MTDTGAAASLLHEAHINCTGDPCSPRRHDDDARRWLAAAERMQATSAFLDRERLEWLVEQIPTMPGDYTAIVGKTGRGPFVSLPAVHDAMRDASRG
jgi:hypothetical protein